FVHRAVADAFERKLAEKILTEVPVSSNPADEKAYVGPLIDKAAADRIDTWIQSARKNGAAALIEGKRIGERMITPWLLQKVPPTEPLSCEEVFGPVVLFHSVPNIQEAIA